MTPSDSNPKLPLWIFFVTDAALIAAAWFVAERSAKPLSLEAALIIVGCIAFGAIATLVPIVSRFEQSKNETLDDRQRALEALARTLTAAAEQISIAAGGLHEVADLAQKNLRQAEQLPHKLQDKIAEFQARLADANDTEKEELEKELVALRTTESERLEATSTRIAKAVAEFAKLEAATQQHLATANEAVARLSMGTAAAIGKAQVAAEQALAQARTEAARGLGDAAGQATKAIESAKVAALADIDAKLGAIATALVERVAREAGNKSAPPAPVTTAEPAGTVESIAPAAEITKSETTSQPPKRPRKRREDAPTEETAATADDTSPKIQVIEEPTPIPVEKIPEVTAVAPDSAQPFNHVAGAPEPVTTVPAESSEVPIASSESPPVSTAPKTPRKRAPRKTESAPEPATATSELAETKTESPKDPADLSLPLDDIPARPAASVSERAATSDGATRLMVTAYIGIGNRLFIRGAGPGLTWEKGVPLQFVSIGKWRWETNDASSPVEFKLYKNDDVECAALGAQRLDPGYQQEITAAF